MDCTQAQKVRYGTHMLAVEADDWWLETRQRLEVVGEEITRVVFRREFLMKYYPEDVPGKKETEFLELKQGNMLVTKYAAKFTELAKIYLYYDGVGSDFSKCIKFENGLRSKIKKVVGYQKIRIFSDLVDSCRTFKEDHNTHYKIVKDRRGKADVADSKRTSRGEALASVICFNYGKPGQKSNACNLEVKKCFRWGKMGHAMSDCKHREIVYFNFSEEGHIGSQCLKQNKTQSGGKVFALAGSQTDGGNEHIGGTIEVSWFCPEFGQGLVVGSNSQSGKLFKLLFLLSLF
ncbi:uncharacterized protein LOC131618832 [Vicia villosa]|uniref:uncharacterized protein LOC131618832 n=1 Tax=Vicia villosa TaxID=3911 RepID=UPI00273B1AA7|nr:uncharacterized protein LOC131618832 [Vicia villosa]